MFSPAFFNGCEYHCPIRRSYSTSVELPASKFQVYVTLIQIIGFIETKDHLFRYILTSMGGAAEVDR